VSKPKTAADVEAYITELQKKVTLVKKSDYVRFDSIIESTYLVGFSHQSIIANEILKAVNEAALNVLYKEIETYQSRLKQLQK
jgi:hypothetical protein